MVSLLGFLIYNITYKKKKKRCYGFHGDLFKKWKLEAETHASGSLIVLLVGRRMRGWS
jgi:hypothetical protein